MNFENIKCSRCNHINPPYKNICEECKNYLRGRVVNIDLWETVLKLIEEPKSAFKTIIYAEHKNFILFLLFFISIKNLIITRYISVPELGTNGVKTSLMLSFVLTLITTIIFFSIITVIQIFLTKNNLLKLRFIDLVSTNIYTFVPYLIGLVFIFPVELVVLGSDIFSNNPYSFEIKPTITYILIGFEILTILWVILLNFKSIIFIGIKKNITFFLTLLFLVIWICTLYISSKIIFTI
jgi:hypothetical protein